MAARPILAIISLILTAGACLLLFFVVLGGTRNVTPLNDVYFLRADTSNISGAPRMTRWTLWDACATSPDELNDCGSAKPAYPLDPPRNFGTLGVPGGFLNTNRYYLMTRFMFAFILIALFFAVLAFFAGLLALVSRLGGALSGLLAGIALFFQCIVAALMTAAYVLGRRQFRLDGREAHLGPKAFAFVWTAVACLLLSTILFCAILGTGRDTTRTRRGYFGRRRSARDRGSFIESESQRRVKDEYS